MVSKWIHLKDIAIQMRKDGHSIGDIERKYGIPKSTLSGWLRDIKLTNTQIEKLNKKVYMSLVNARKTAIKWHHHQKELRLNQAKNEAEKILSNLDIRNKKILETCLAMIYLGEGSKNNTTSLGNTNPVILKFFIKSLKLVFGIKHDEFKCDLHLRSDQDGNKMINYWSKELKIPKSKFIAIRDKRIAKSKTYPNYKGVCVVRCGKIAIQRRITYLGEGFCSKIIDMDD